MMKLTITMKRMYNCRNRLLKREGAGIVFAHNAAPFCCPLILLKEERV